jgi:NADP-dependent 3-hydroxy acid dehydrogenase YdfG
MSNALPSAAQLFDVKGKVAIITGASGAFGMVAARVLAQAGARLVLAAGKQSELDAISAECRALGATVAPVNRRPNTEADCEAIMETATSQFGGVDILVVASGLNDVSMIT